MPGRVMPERLDAFAVAGQKIQQRLFALRIAEEPVVVREEHAPLLAALQLGQESFLLHVIARQDVAEAFMRVFKEIVEQIAQPESQEQFSGAAVLGIGPADVVQGLRAFRAFQQALELGLAQLDLGAQDLGVSGMIPVQAEDQGYPAEQAG